jgi:hypothetical protein
MRSRHALFLLIVLALAPAAASAGERAGDAGRLDLGLFGGASLLSVSRDVEVFPPCIAIYPPPASCGPFVEHTELGASFLFGGVAAYRLAGRAWLEASLAMAPSHAHDTRGNDLVFRGTGDSLTTYHEDLALRLDLGGTRLAPFLMAGAGRIQYSRAYSETAADWSANFGAGLRLRLETRAALRLDVVDHVVPDEYFSGKTQHDLHVRVAVTVRP